MSRLGRGYRTESRNAVVPCLIAPPMDIRYRPLNRLVARDAQLHKLVVAVLPRFQELVTTFIGGCKGVGEDYDLIESRPAILTYSLSAIKVSDLGESSLRKQCNRDDQQDHESRQVPGRCHYGLLGIGGLENCVRSLIVW